MPVLDNALLGCAIAFTPLLVVASPSARRVARATAGRPASCRGAGPLLAQMLLDCDQPGPQALGVGAAGSVLRAHRPAARRSGASCQPPALVIGHPRDPIHPFSDSDMLVRELPHARLIEASSIVELRTSPRAPDRRDREVHRRVLGRAARRAPSARSGAPGNDDAGDAPRPPRLAARRRWPRRPALTTLRRRCRVARSRRRSCGASARSARPPAKAAARASAGRATASAAAGRAGRRSCSVVLLSGGRRRRRRGGQASAVSAVLPGGGSVPDRKITDLKSAAAKAAGCELTVQGHEPRAHGGPRGEDQVLDQPADVGQALPGASARTAPTSTAPDVKELVHALEHGRVVIWFKKSLPKARPREPQDAVRRGHLPDDADPQRRPGMTYAGGGQRLERATRPHSAPDSCWAARAHDRHLRRDPGVQGREPQQRAGSRPLEPWPSPLGRSPAAAICNVSPKAQQRALAPCSDACGEAVPPPSPRWSACSGSGSWSRRRRCPLRRYRPEPGGLLDRSRPPGRRLGDGRRAGHGVVSEPAARAQALQPRRPDLARRAARAAGRRFAPATDGRRVVALGAALRRTPATGPIPAARADRARRGRVPTWVGEADWVQYRLSEPPARAAAALRQRRGHRHRRRPRAHRGAARGERRRDLAGGLARGRRRPRRRIPSRRSSRARSGAPTMPAASGARDTARCTPPSSTTPSTRTTTRAKRRPTWCSASAAFTATRTGGTTSATTSSSTASARSTRDGPAGSTSR